MNWAHAASPSWIFPQHCLFRFDDWIPGFILQLRETRRFLSLFSVAVAVGRNSE